jgi:hypothetical protein
MVWTNPLKWLRAFYHYEVTGINTREGIFYGTAQAAGRLFRAVEKWREQGLTWEAVEDDLEMMHSVLPEVDGNWA